jgi:type IV pilus assembly protein PilC
MEQGGDLAELMEREGRTFPPLLITLVRTGEASGNLSETLRLAATHTWRMGQLRAQVKTALAYPIVVLVIMFAVIFGIARFVVPPYVAMFTDMGVALPLPTTILFRVATHPWILLGSSVIVVLLLIGLLKAMNTSEEALALKRWTVFHVPVLGRVLWASYLTQFCRSMSLMLGSGLTVDRALELVTHLGAGVVPRRLGESMVRSVQGGRALSGAMLLHAGMFPEMLRYMVATAEQSGRLPEAFGEAADLYEREAERNAAVLQALMPPIMVIFVAHAIAFVVVALYLPMLTCLSSLA